MSDSTHPAGHYHKTLHYQQQPCVKSLPLSYLRLLRQKNTWPTTRIFLPSSTKDFSITDSPQLSKHAFYKCTAVCQCLRCFGGCGLTMWRAPYVGTISWLGRRPPQRLHIFPFWHSSRSQWCFNFTLDNITMLIYDIVSAFIHTPFVSSLSYLHPAVLQWIALFLIIVPHLSHHSIVG